MSSRDRLIVLIFVPIMLCCSAPTYYAQNCAYVKDLCLRINFSIRIYHGMVTVLLEYLCQSFNYSSANN